MGNGIASWAQKNLGGNGGGWWGRENRFVSYACGHRKRLLFAFADIAISPEPADLRPHYPSPVPALSNSLMEVFARVFSSTRLTITAAYRLCEPSAAGRVPDTTTLPAGTRP